MKRLDQRVRHPWLLGSVVLYVAASLWSVHQDGWMSPALVPLVFLPVGAATALLMNLVARWPYVLDRDARRFMAQERQVEHRRREIRHSIEGQLSIVPAAASGALSVSDRDRGA